MPSTPRLRSPTRPCRSQYPALSTYSGTPGGVHVSSHRPSRSRSPTQPCRLASRRIQYPALSRNQDPPPRPRRLVSRRTTPWNGTPPPRNLARTRSPFNQSDVCKAANNAGGHSSRPSGSARAPLLPRLRRSPLHGSHLCPSPGMPEWQEVYQPPKVFPAVI